MFETNILNLTLIGLLVAFNQFKVRIAFNLYFKLKTY